MKTICKLKNWEYDKEKDTTAKLVAICKANGLFPSFYVTGFENTGTVRNKLSSSHGRADELYTVTDAHVDHFIQATSAHIVFFIKLASL
jgi:hypothetical protein